MSYRWSPREHLLLGKYVIRWLLIGIPVGGVVGLAVAGFLWGLDEVTQLRWKTDMASGVPWLLMLLPFAGMGIGWAYHIFGQSVEGGNNLIIDQIHDPGGGVPSRMAPLVLSGTLVTHLFGGSAGREGTAVQMGGSIASTVGRWFRFDADNTRTLLMCGVAAGFGSVFGTPFTGAIFAVEVLAIGLINFASIVPCLIASVVGNWVTIVCGIRHTSYHIANFSDLQLTHITAGLDWLLLGKVVLASVAFGLVSVLFAELTHRLGRLCKRYIGSPILRPAIGGLLVIGLTFWIGPDYLGIGVSPDPHFPNQICIVSCFHGGGATHFSWWWKLLFTAITLSTGFKGGEVTPLFFIGAALGNTLAILMHAPVDLFAGLGFVAVFAGATNTPLACTIMGLELFASTESNLIQSGGIVYLATACFLSNLLSGNSTIYPSQYIRQSYQKL